MYTTSRTEVLSLTSCFGIHKCKHNGTERVGKDKENLVGR